MELNADLAIIRQRSMLIVREQLSLASSMTLMKPINVNQFFTCGQQLDVEKKFSKLIIHFSRSSVSLLESCPVLGSKTLFSLMVIIALVFDGLFQVLLSFSSLSLSVSPSSTLSFFSVQSFNSTFTNSFIHSPHKARAIKS